MKILELFSGKGSISQVFKDNGHEVFRVEWDKQFNADLYKDIEFLTINDIPFIPDLIWASPDCTTYSIAGISHHRKNIDGKNIPFSDYAKKSDRVNENLWYLIAIYKTLNTNLLYFVENPRGYYRKMYFKYKDYLQPHLYTVTYCQYGDTRMKPTDIFTNHDNPNFKPMCKNGDSCHVSAPRGSKTIGSTQGLKKVNRSMIPDQLCKKIVELGEDYNGITHN